MSLSFASMRNEVIKVALTIFLPVAVCCLFAHTAESFTPTSDKPVAQEGSQEMKIVAKVNNHPIYEKELAREFQNLLSKYQKYGFDKSNKEAVANLRKQALTALVDRKVLYSAYSTATVEDMDARLAAEIANLRQLAPSDKDYELLLQARFGSKEAMDEILRTKILMEAYLDQKGLSKPVIPEEELRDFYEQSKEGLKQPEGLKTKHILVAVPEGADENTWKEAEKKITDIKQKIVSGAETFENMVKENSDCGDTKEKGGDLGYIAHGFMPAEFDEVAFKLPLGQLSDPVKTKYGYHLIKTEKLRAAGYTPFEEARSFLEKFLQGQKKTQAVQKHIRVLRDDAEIEILSE